VDLLKERYKWSDDAAQEFADFLLPMLDYDPRRRATAEQCLRHPWLRPCHQAEASSASTDASSPAATQHEFLEHSAELSAEHAEPKIATQTLESVVIESKCDAAAETVGDANALLATSPATDDDNA